MSLSREGELLDQLEELTERYRALLYVANTLIGWLEKLGQPSLAEQGRIMAEPYQDPQRRPN